MDTLANRGLMLHRIALAIAAAGCAAALVGCTSAPKPAPMKPIAQQPAALAPAVPAPAAAAPVETPRSRGLELKVVAAPTAPTAMADAPVPKPAPPATPQAAPPLPPLPSIMPFDEAIAFAAKNLFTNAKLPVSTLDKYPLVIDPLIDGNSGAESTATRTIESRVTELLKTSYPKFELQPFATNVLARGPLLFIGTFTAVDKDGKNAGPRDWFRVCLALVDLRSGLIISKGFARAATEGVDVTPTKFFQDSPAWAPDPAIDGYVRTCQGTKAGDPINPAYYDKIITAALINDAKVAYEAGRYEEALDLYRGVARTSAGDQLRVHNGAYLASWKLGRKDDAMRSFARIVEHGLAQNRLAVKFLFRPGSTLFWADPAVSEPYPMWLKQIAHRSKEAPKCIEVAGHTSRTGPEPLNDRLSMMRAQYVKQRLEADVPLLVKRTSAVGKGSRENISGLGTDDARDAVDRRVEFKVAECVG